MRDLAVTYLAIADLKPYARNPRTHSKKQLRQIADSIETFGWTNPILIDAEGGVIAGHGRLEAAKLLSLETVPTIRIENLSEAQKRAYVIADNKLAENAGWDLDLLGLELQGLLELVTDFDITLTGFEMGEIDVLIDGLDADGDGDADDDVPPVDLDRPAVMRAGHGAAYGRRSSMGLPNTPATACSSSTRPSSRLTARQPAQKGGTGAGYRPLTRRPHKQGSRRSR